MMEQNETLWRDSIHPVPPESDVYTHFPLHPPRHSPILSCTHIIQWVAPNLHAQAIILSFLSIFSLLSQCKYCHLSTLSQANFNTPLFVSLAFHPN